MEIKITQSQFDLFKNGEITSSFEDVDVNNDGQITNADLEAAQDDAVKSDIQKLLDGVDEEAELLDFNLSDLAPEEKASTDTPATSNEANVAQTPATNETSNADANAVAPAVSNEASTPVRTDNGDGTYSTTTTKDDGSSVKATYDSTTNKLLKEEITKEDGTKVTKTYNNDEKISRSEKQNADGRVLRSAEYTYNEDGSYTRVAKNMVKATTVTTDFDSEGKKLKSVKTGENSASSTTVYTYNEDGSYVATTTNDLTGRVTEDTFDAQGRKISSVTKNRQGNPTGYTSYEYNQNGSYQAITTNPINGMITTMNFGVDGRKISAMLMNNGIMMANYSFAYVMNNLGGFAINQINVLNGVATSYQFNALGILTQQINTMPDGSQVITNFQYNPDGSFSKIITTSPQTKTVIQNFGANGMLQSQMNLYPDGSTQAMKFDIFGRAVSNTITVPNDNGTFTATSIMFNTGKTVVTELDSDKKKISGVSKNKGGKTISTSKFEYNEDGSYTQTITNVSNGSTTVRNYDKDGNLKSSVTKDSNGVVTKRTKIDDEGNKRVVNYTDGKPATATKSDSSGKELSSTLYNHNEDGSFNTVTTDSATGDTATRYFNVDKKITRREDKDKDGNLTKESSFEYNEDGGYTKTTTDAATGEVTTEQYDKDGKKIEA